MKILLLATATAASLLAAPQAQAHDASWELRPTGVDMKLRAVSAVNSHVAWTSGGREVLRTTDGGRSWQAVAPPDTADLDFRDVEAFDAWNAFVMAIGPADTSRIYRTSDGGRTWALSFKNDDPAAFYDCMAFFDRFRGLALSDSVDGKFRVSSTIDGGRSWQRVPEENFPPAIAGEFSFAASGQCVSTAGPRDAWIATGGGATARVLHSGDGGRHWTVSDTPLPGSATTGAMSVAFRNARQGVVVGGDYKNPASRIAGLAWSGDGGATWEGPAQSPFGYRPGAAWWGDSVIVVGPTGSDLSRDGGRTWRSLDTGSFETIDCAAVCWAAGEHGRAGVLSRR
ncbi:WD40/YVTN/BNR-like repeat-containing protein [Saccharothrix deserti]|uniref:WD40/YVTN/BNR-like repeat-containing protein n=1 Tax=Saccharothrix deserti TaxID=2593674 RepID=UPI00131B8ADC|nr:oxidoreductase [Saccharothrix deserti]